MPYYEDIVVGLTEAFGSYEITREEVISFAQRYDPQDFHLDDDAAAKGPFGKLAASGWMTASITMRMIVDNWRGGDTSSRGGAGIEDLRWIRPVYPGDVLSVRETTLSKRRSKSRPELGIVARQVETLDQDGNAVMTMTTNAMFAVRDPDGVD